MVLFITTIYLICHFEIMDPFLFININVVFLYDINHFVYTNNIYININVMALFYKINLHVIFNHLLIQFHTLE